MVTVATGAYKLNGFPMVRVQLSEKGADWFETLFVASLLSDDAGEQWLIIEVDVEIISTYSAEILQ